MGTCGYTASDTSTRGQKVVKMLGNKWRKLVKGKIWMRKEKVEEICGKDTEEKIWKNGIEEKEKGMGSG